MSTFNTRCPSCHSLNRVPEQRITESPNCGKCQSALLDGAPIEGTEANFSALLQKRQTCRRRFLGTMV
ncbi:thioredoxin 2 [Vibrio cholerae]|nr:thioredoxin 2 [Vibrio cholerae]